MVDMLTAVEESAVFKLTNSIDRVEELSKNIDGISVSFQYHTIESIPTTRNDTADDGTTILQNVLNVLQPSI